MLKAFKYRIYPNEEQKIQLAKTFGCTRFIYNYYLAKKIDLYKTDGKSISKYDCNSHCNKELKKSEQFKWLKDVDKFALTNSIYSLDSAYKKFLKNIQDFLSLRVRKYIIILIQLTLQIIIYKLIL